MPPILSIRTNYFSKQLKAHFQQDLAEKVVRRKFSENNISNFVKLLESEAWDCVNLSNDVNVKYTSFYKRFIILVIW